MPTSENQIAANRAIAAARATPTLPNLDNRSLHPDLAQLTEANKREIQPEKNARATRSQIFKQNKGLTKSVEAIQAPHGPKKCPLLTQFLAPTPDLRSSTGFLPMSHSQAESQAQPPPCHKTRAFPIRANPRSSAAKGFDFYRPLDRQPIT